MEIDGRTVGDIVADDYRLGAVFKRFGIDFCCGGGQSVQAACDKRGVEIEELRAALTVAGDGRNNVFAPDVRNWSPSFLADFIVNVHHSYVRESLPILQAFAQKVARVHGHARSELYEISDAVMSLADELTLHLAKEETELFPEIKKGIARDGYSAASMQLLYDEHDQAGAIMQRIRELTNGFVPPEWACNTYKALFAKLEEFEEDLHRHVYLENNVLFPSVKSSQVPA